jgi:cytoskeletal protein CcmA (bactofilin family)
MWKKDEAVRPAPGRETTTPTPATPSAPPPSTAVAPPSAPRQIERGIVNIGKSVVIKGELTGSEDLTIEGQVEGKIELRDNVLTIGANGKIKAQVFAKSVIVLGEVVGNVSAAEKVDIRDNGSVEGDIVSPRVAIAEGALFRGSVDMQRAGKPAQSKVTAASEPKTEPKMPVSVPASAPAASPAQVTRVGASANS